MPFRIKRFKSGFKVYDDEGKAYSNKPLTKKRATAQLRALYANIPEERVYKGKGFMMFGDNLYLDEDGCFSDSNSDSESETDILESANKALGKGMVKMTKKQFVGEHNKLIDLLDTTSKKLSAEAKEQAQELKKVKKGGCKMTGAEVCHCEMGGKGQSEYSKKHVETLKRISMLPAEEQAKLVKKGEQRRQEIIKEIEEKQRKIEEYNREMERRRNSPFAPLVEGLTKLGDVAVKYGSVVGLPSIVSEAYKKFAPPGSQYYTGSGKTKKWVQKVVEDMKKGAFTKQALRHHMTPVEFAEEVLAHPDKYTLTTRRRAQFLKNIGDLEGSDKKKSLRSS